MIRVAICGNEPPVLEQIRKVVDKIWGAGYCDQYRELDQLFAALKSGGKYSAVIMDIEWKGDASGIEAAQKIQLMDPKIRIIYMTHYPERYIQQIFLKPANISGFLIKPVDEKLLEENLQKIKANEPKNDHNRLLVKHKSTIFSIHFKEIRYLESAGHVVTIHTRTDSHSCYDRLEKLYERLPEYFVQCHKSYVVNMNEIRRIERGQVLMDDEIRIPISKARYGMTKSRYYHYMEGLLFRIKNIE